MRLEDVANVALLTATMSPRKQVGVKNLNV
jgi:hypothetical protein